MKCKEFSRREFLQTSTGLATGSLVSTLGCAPEAKKPVVSIARIRNDNIGYAVEQAIDLRLSTTVGSMIKQTAYGLIGQPGIAGTDLALKYIRMGLKAALIQDPRIEDIQNINVLVDGDKVQANMDIYVVGYDTSLPVSVII